jgi:hypothetical protein
MVAGKFFGIIVASPPEGIGLGDGAIWPISDATWRGRQNTAPFHPPARRRKSLLPPRVPGGPERG